MASVVVPIYLRWSDMDIYHHVNNVAYANYLESARVQFLANHGLEPTVDGYGQLVARLEIDYKAPLEYHAQPVDMELWVSKIGASTYEINYELRDSQTIYVQAKTLMVCVSVEHGVPGRIPEKLLTILRATARS
ncbi:MAG: acyl-CoA thioesterase [Actinobacteria bacterium]|nr:acyl-CoA thioesterase [Actinomycetota bacterium]NBY15171.1 acyl-CoA thioesterase [Actinomycetota bacterium]